MKFCTSCGAALEFFEFLDGELCSSCLGKNGAIKTTSAATEEKKEPETVDLSGIILCVEDNKIVLKSEQGWVLWSGSTSEKHHVQSALRKAEQIFKIRKKRLK